MNNMNGKVLKEGYTFDDVLLVPAYSKVVPAAVDLKTRLTQKIILNIPVASAAMDTVTEEAMAKKLALLGGIGFIHKNLTIEEQASMVKAVKDHIIEERYENACVDSLGRLIVGAAVGVGNNTMDRVKTLVEAGVEIGRAHV